MKIKLILSIVFLGIMLGIFCFSLLDEPKISNNFQENKMYQGPVPEGYDLEYFRETGITKIIEDKDGYRD